MGVRMEKLYILPNRNTTPLPSMKIAVIKRVELGIQTSVFVSFLTDMPEATRHLSLLGLQVPYLQNGSIGPEGLLKIPSNLKFQDSS